MSEREIPYRMVLLDKIIVGDRFRKDYGDLTETKDSIERNGLFHPLVVLPNDDGGYNLLAGGRRYTCCRQLGWIEVPCHLLSDLTEDQRLEVELEENEQRKDMTYDERCALRLRIHEVKQRLYSKDSITQAVQDGNRANQYGAPTSGWSMQDTANSLGTSKSRISADISMARIKEAVPELKGLDESESARRVRKMVEDIEREISLRQSITKMLGVEDLWCADAYLAVRHLPDKSVDLVIWDPPYGTDVQDTYTGDGDGGKYFRSAAHYQDTKEKARETIAKVLPELKRAMKDNAHAYIFFGITEYVWVHDLLSNTFGDRLDSIPLIWSKAGNRWGTGDWRHHYTRSYESCFFVSNPDRVLSSVHPSVFTEGAGEDVQYAAQKPLALIQVFIEQSSKPGELVVDATAGHGSTPIACVRTGRRFWACEENEQAYRIMKHRVALELRSKAEKEMPNGSGEGELEPGDTDL